MRILIVTEVFPPGVGGVPTAIDTLARGLTKAGDNVTVITGSAKTSTRLSRDRTHREYTVYRVPAIPSLFNPRNNRMSVAPPLVLKRFWRDQEKFDVVHMHTPISWMHKTFAKLATESQIPYITTNHVMAENLTMNNRTLLASRFMKAYQRMAQAVIDKGAAVTAPTEAALRVMHKTTAPLVVPISNGLDTGYYTPGKADPGIIDKYGLDVDRPVLIYTGRLDGEKRVDLLIEAMPSILKIHPGTQLVIVGRGMLADSLREQVSRLDLDRAVIFCGFVSDEEKLHLLRAADLFVNASPAELQCISALEALATGLPIVVADQVALPELVDGGKNGVTFGYPEANSLAKAVGRLLASQQERQQMSSQAREWVVSNHDAVSTVEQYRQVYRDVIGLV